MDRSHRITLAASLLLLASSAWTSARAGPPSAAMSYEDPCLVACPAGDIVFLVITNHIDGVPWAEGPVTLDFCACPRVRLRPGTFGYTVAPPGCRIWQEPVADGSSRFGVAAGGGCGDSMQIDAEGMFLGRRPVSSPDQDGDLVVTASDLQAIQGKLGTADRTADLDCDGAVTQADYAIAVSHLGHGGVTTGVLPSLLSAGDLGFSRPPSPNPARGPVYFALRVPVDQNVDLAVLDLTGRRVATLWQGVLTAGEHGFRWEGGRSRRAGLYVVSARGGDRQVARQVVLLQ